MLGSNGLRPSDPLGRCPRPRDILKTEAGGVDLSCCEVYQALNVLKDLPYVEPR